MSAEFNDSVVEAMRARAAEIREQIKAESTVTLDDVEYMDEVFWRYAYERPWHAAASAVAHRVLLRGKALKTAAAGWLDGQMVLAVNVDFFRALTPAQQMFVLTHEVDHLVRGHIQSMVDWPLLKQALNYAQDAVINESILKEFGGSRDQVPLKGITLAAVKESLDPEKGKEFLAMDERTFADAAVSEELARCFRQDDGSPTKVSMDEMYGGGGEFFDDGSVDEEAQKADVEAMVNEAESVAAGNTPGYLVKSIAALRDKTNRNWRMVVRGVGSSSRIAMTCSWSRINKRLPFLRPGRLAFTRPRVFCLVDRSGSVGPEETASFIKELNGLTTHVDLDLGFIDSGWNPEETEGQLVRNVRNVDDVLMKFKDMGGGTDFSGFYEWWKTQGTYESLIILTDGYLANVPLVPGLLAKANVLILTPNHNAQMAAEAASFDWKVVVIDDSKKGGRN